MKRIELNLTTETDAYDPHATMSEEELSDYQERYRKAVETRLSEMYDDADVEVGIGGFGSLDVEGFDNSVEVRQEINRVEQSIWGDQLF